MTHSSSEHPAAAPPGSGARGITATAWRFRRLVAACVLACILLAALLTLAATDRYTATAKLLFRDPGLSRTLFGSGLFEGSVDPARNASTNVEIVKSEAVSRRVERALGRTTARLPGDVEVEGTNNADVVSIAATADTARDAAAVANAYAREYIAFQRDTDRATVRDARETVERSLDEASAEERAGLIESARQLRILETLQTGNAEIIARASAPGSPSQPQPRRNLLIGLLAGLLLGVGLALLRERADRRLRSSQEIEEAIGRPVLARIPSDPRPADVYTEPSAFDEPYRQLRESLRYLDAARPHRCLVVTSADPGEGTTTVATNLARALVADGERVLLIDAGLARRDGTDGMPATGFAEVLSGRVTLDEAMVPCIEGTYPAVLKAGT